MANAIYPKWKEAAATQEANTDLNAVTVKVALIDTGAYTYNAAHDFLDDVTGIIGTAQTLNNKTFTNGIFDADDVTYTAVTGNSVEALIIYVDTGSAATSRLIAYIDTNVTNLPFTPNGGNVIIAWNATGILTF